jgi:hypothetical protein
MSQSPRHIAPPHGQDPANDAARELFGVILEKHSPERAIQIALSQACNIAISFNLADFPLVLRKMADDWPALVARRLAANGARPF